MNRRDLFKFLGAIGIALPSLLEAAPVVAQRKPSRGIYRVGFVRAFGRARTLDKGCAGRLTVRRASGAKLLELSLHTYGGSVAWDAPLWSELVFMGHEIPRVSASRNIDWAIPLIDPDDGRESIVIGSHNGRRFHTYLNGPSSPTEGSRDG